LKKVDSFVLKSFIGPLVFTFFIVLIILILQFLWMYVDELAGKGLEFKVLAELLYHFSLTFVPMALPLAILLASLMTFGNMGEFSELTALKSSGVSLQRIMRPLMVLIGMLAVVSFVFANNVLPYSTAKARTLLWDIRRKKPDINIQAGTFYNGVPGFSIKITEKDPESGCLHDLIIYDHREGRGNTSVTIADSGYMKTSADESGLIMTLYNGYSYSEISERTPNPAYRKFPSRRAYFKEQTIVISLSGFDLERSQDGMFKSNAAMKNISELTFYIDSLKTRYNERVSFQFKEYNETKIYSERYFVRNEADSSAGTALPTDKPFDVRKLYDSLPVTEQRMVVVKAIENLKDANAYISQKNEAHHFEKKAIRRYEVEWNKKITMSFSCIVFFLIGAPLGAIIRKGGLGTPAVISIFFFVVYYVISLSAQKLVEENVIGTLAGMWASSYILLPIGIFLTYKATTDSVVMNVDTYITLIKKVVDKIMSFLRAGKKHWRRSE
jgi:lipopolysaccharide export system permease protein